MGLNEKFKTALFATKTFPRRAKRKLISSRWSIAMVVTALLYIVAIAMTYYYIALAVAAGLAMIFSTSSQPSPAPTGAAPLGV